MNKVFVPMERCKDGDIIASSIIDKYDSIVALEGTSINKYIKDRLINAGLSFIWIYESCSGNTMSLVNPAYEGFKRGYQINVLNIKMIISELSSGMGFNIKTLDNLSEYIHKKIEQDYYIINCLKEIRSADEYTYAHSLNVAFYSMLIGKWINLNECEIETVIKAGLLHDIGKIKVPKDILNKPSKLLPDEFSEIKKHTIYGYDLLNTLNNLPDDIKNVVLMHHERENSSGYPNGVNGSEINVYTKIVAIADVFDAMTSERAYKKRSTPFKAFEMFETEGVNNFDSWILKIFLTNICAYYIGSKVVLSNGEIGEIIYIPPYCITNPVIKIGEQYFNLSDKPDLSIIQML